MSFYPVVSCSQPDQDDLVCCVQGVVARQEGSGLDQYDKSVSYEDHLVDLVVKASASRAEGPGFESRLRRDFFLGRVIPVT